MREAAVVLVVLAVLGLGLGLLWLWLAPRVPLISDASAVFLKDTEGEEAIGADGTFVLLALAFGLVSAVALFLWRRRGGIPLVVGLALGGVLGSVVAWKFGVWLGPTSDVVAHAKAVGKGVTFDAPLQLNAEGRAAGVAGGGDSRPPGPDGAVRSPRSGTGVERTPGVRPPGEPRES